MAQDDPGHEATTVSEPDADLFKHIESLGLQTTGQYVEWCARHGFSRRTKKHWKERLKEHAFATRHLADARLAQQKTELRQPEKIIDAILRGDLHEDAVTQLYLKAICRALQSCDARPESRAAFGRLLHHVPKHADLLGVLPVIPHLGQQAGNTFIDGLLALARHSVEWLRPVEDWKPRTHSARRQFASLARHLFAQWPLPTFLDSVWFKGDSLEAVRQQYWFMCLGAGWSVRLLDLPLPYTKRMAHHFLHAPADSPVEAALRWGQIHGLDGDIRLVRAVCGTRLGTTFEHEDFWAEVLRFFIAHPMLDRAHLGPVVDFLRYEKFTPQEVFVAPGGVERRPPPQPAFSLKGRTPATLLRLVASWHRSLGHARQPQAQWPRSGIPSFQWVEGAGKGGTLRVWTITELLNTQALVAEGRAMQHCVATYTQSCLHGVCSIWSLEVECGEERRRVLTVEVQTASRTICQARGKCNAAPVEKHREILRRWASQAGLNLADFV